MLTRIKENLALDNDRIKDKCLQLYLAVTLAVPNIVLKHFYILVDELDRHISKNVILNFFKILDEQSLNLGHFIQIHTKYKKGEGSNNYFQTLHSKVHLMG